MKLRFSPTSPYVRKVMVTAIELGIMAEIEKVPTNPWDPATDIATDNPIGKVPALTLDDGRVLFDSVVICEYLDASAGGSLFPTVGDARWTALRRHALADGALDAGVSRFLERNRPDGERSESWIARQTTVLGRGLDAMEAEADGLGDGITIGHIAFGCTLGWADFRCPDEDWRAERPALADWFDTFSARKSMMETVPKLPK